MVGLSTVDSTSDINKPVYTAVNRGLALDAKQNSPICSGTFYGIDKTMVGLSVVDNISDINNL